MSDADTNAVGAADRLGAFLPVSMDSVSRTRLLLVPLLLFDLLVFLVPMGYLVRVSLYERDTAGSAYVGGTWSVESYRHLAGSELVWDVFAWTMGFAVVATVLSVGIGTLYAYVAWRASGLTRTMLLAGVVVSMFTTLVVKLFAARLLLEPDGAVNDTLLASGLVGEPLALVNNEIGVLIGQLYIVLPYTVLAVYSVLTGLDERLIEAANDLGATPTRAVREVVIPHAVPGMAVGGVIAFAWSAGAFAAPLLLGSPSEHTVAVEVQRLLNSNFDYPSAAALAIVLTTVVLAVLAAGAAWLQRRGGLNDV